jgi:hypothetical protein
MENQLNDPASNISNEYGVKKIFLYGLIVTYYLMSDEPFEARSSSKRT